MAAVLATYILIPAIANGAALTQTSTRLGRLVTSATTNNDLLVTFKLNTTPTNVAKIKVTFPTGFTLTTGTPTPVTTGFPTAPASITATPGTLTSAVTGAGAGLGGTIVVSGITSASLTNSTLYGFIIPTGSITNPASAGGYNLVVESQNSGNTTIDSTTVQVYITGTNSDQVTVTASVAPNFSFSLSATTDTVPKVDPSIISTSTGVTMTVGTNSPLGYTAYVKSANASLTSATNPGTPITNGTFNSAVDTVTAGTTKYGFVPSTGTLCTTCSGSLGYEPEYAVASGTQAGAFNGTNFAAFVSRSGYTNADQILLRERVAVNNTIGYANDYTDTLTIVAAGNF
jgi:hypothetical protein